MNRLLQALFTFLLLTSSIHAATVQGVVISTDGQPIAGAAVRAYSFESAADREDRLRSNDPERKPVAEKATDANGKFTVDIGKHPAVHVMVSAKGFSPGGAFVAADDETGVIALARAAEVRGKVSANGKPVSGAVVAFGSSGANVELRTDDKGEYSVADPGKWAWTVSVSHPDFAVRSTGGSGREKIGVDFTLDSGVLIKGRVLGADGKSPVAGAGIFVDRKRVALSADDGTFTIEHAPAQWRTIEARTADQIAVVTRSSSTEIVLKLKRGAILSGVVRDGATGRELPGASISVSEAEARLGPDLSAEGAFTDSKGRFRIGPLPAASYTLTARFPGYLPRDEQFALRPGESLDRTVNIARGGRIEGWVRDEDKAAVAGALIRSEFLPTSRSRMVTESAWSGPDGRFLFGPLDSTNTLELIATKKGLPEGRASGVAIAAPERKRNVIITIPSGIAVPVRVTDSSGAPIAGATISPQEAQHDMYMGGRRFLPRGVEPELATTGKDGSVELRLKRGKYDLTAKAAGFAPNDAVGVDVAERMVPVEIVLSPGVEIRGRVVSASGSPLEGVSISVPVERGDINFTTTAPDGSFVLSDLAPGEVLLVASKPDQFLRIQKLVMAPANDLVIEAPAGGRVSGRVIDKSTKKPIADFSAGFSGERSGGGMRSFGPPMVRTFHSEDGTFVLENVPAGRHTLIASAAGYVRGEVPAVEVIEGKAVEDLEIALDTGVRVVGTVTGPDGSPLSGVSVSARSEGQRPSFAFGGGATTDTSGDYVLEAVESGEKIVSFDRDGYITQRKSAKLSGKEVRVDARLSRGTEVTGTVVLESGVPVPDVTVRAISAAEGAGYDQVRTDPNGVFRFIGLAPGRYNFQASKSGYPDTSVRDVDIAAAPNVRIVLQPGAVIYGRVTGFRPEDAKNVMVVAGSGSSWSETRIDSSGAYRMEGAPTGSVSVSAVIQNMGSHTEGEEKRVEVAAGSSVQVDLAFGLGSTVDGRVTRDGRAVSGARIMARPKDRRISTSGSAISGSDGTFSISGLADGEYDLVAMEMGTLTSFTANCTVAGASRCDVEMVGASVRGAVRDASTGEPIAGASVTVNQTASQRFPAAATTDSRGTFVLESLSPGSYQVRAEKKGYGQQILDLVVTDAPPQELDFRLSASDGVRIRLFDARDGRSLGGPVTALDPGGRVASESSMLGADGGYSLSLSPGMYRLIVSASGYAAQSLRINVPSAEVRIGLTPGGRVVFRSSSSRAESGKILLPSGEPHLRGRWNPTGVEIFQPGETTYQNMAPGSYTLVIQDDSGSAKVTKQFTVVEGQTTEVSF